MRRTRVLTARGAFLLGVGLFAASCTHYRRPGGTDTDLARDTVACKREPTYREMRIMASAAPGFSAGFEARRFLKDCLEAHGWKAE